MLTLRQHRGLDEVALAALASQPHIPQIPLPGLPPVRPSESDCSIEVVFEDEEAIDALDVASTTRFVRFSAPYERVEIEELPSLATARTRVRHTTFVKTIAAKAAAVDAKHAAATLSFDKVWFDQPEETFPDQSTELIARTNSWLWLGLSLLGGAIAVGAMFYAL